jgi:hypothetical protein
MLPDCIHLAAVGPELGTVQVVCIFEECKEGKGVNEQYVDIYLCCKTNQISARVIKTTKKKDL